MSSQQIKTRDKLAAGFVKTLGITLEQAYELLPIEKVIEPKVKLETDEELILEAQAVLTYYRERGATFFTETCRSCKEEFVYSYSFTGVKYCSIVCISQALKEIGLSWSIGRELSERYGRYVPAVVPAVAYSLLPAFESSADTADSHTNGQASNSVLPDLDDFLNNLKI